MAINDRQEPGSITKTADAQNERISGISNVSKTVTQMQKTTQRKIEETQESINYGDSPAATSQQMNGVLSSFGKTITAFTKGVENISISTAKATTDAIGQYGKAISQDLNYNKQNIVAMALARSTPLFGYFAAKFMETDVFQKAKERMKESIAGVFKGIGSGIANIFKGGKNAKEATKEKVPKMQKGGYIEKGGMIEVHPAEVVMPIEKILERIDDSISVGREIAEISQKTQMRSLAKMSTFVSGERNKEPVGMVKGFLRALKEVQTQYEEPSNMRMLRAVLSIQDTLGATIGTWQQVWTKMLVEHPTFRQIAFGMKSVATVFGAPFKVVKKFFRSRGSYKSQLSNASNPFQSLGENMGMLYTGSMWRLDNVVKFTKITAQATRDLSSFVTGNKYPKVEGVSQGFWSLFGFARSGLGIIAKPLHMLANKSKFTKWMSASLEAPFEKALLTIFKYRREMKELYGDEYATTNPMLDFIRDQKKKKAPPLLVTIDAGKAQEEAAQEMEETSEGIWEVAKIQKKKWLWEKVQAAKGGIKSVFSWIFKMLMMGGGFIKSLLGFGTGGWMSGLFKKGGLISAGIKGLFAAGGPILSSITSSAFLGPLAAALGGVAIGTWVNNHIIEPYITGPYFDKHKNWQQEGMKERDRNRKQNLDAALGKTATGTALYEGKMAGSVASGLEMQKTLIGPHLSAEKIKASQEKFIDQNIKRYSQFTPEEVESRRKRWRWSGNYLDKYWRKVNRMDPDKYGTSKEKAFLKYLEATGTKNKDLEGSIRRHEEDVIKNMSITEKADYMYRKHGVKGAKKWAIGKGKYIKDQAGRFIEKATGRIIEGKELAALKAQELLASGTLLGQTTAANAKKWIAEKGKYAVDQAGQIVEKATGRVIQGKELAQMQAQELLTSGKLVGQELKKRGLEQVEGLKGLGDQLQQNITQVRNDINQQISNVTRIFNSGNQRSMMDEMSQRVATGNFH